MFDELKPPYSVIYADPPWPYGNFQGKGAAFGETPYKTMSLDDIKAMPVSSIAAPDAWLFMWATFPNLQEGLDTVKAWGFEYKTVAFTWAKMRGDGWYSGLGFYTNANAEVCLLGRRGAVTRRAKDVKQLVVTPVGRHSEKPPEVRDRIVRLCGDVPRIELFARNKAPGWDAFGNQADGIRVPAYVPEKGDLFDANSA